MSNILVVGSLGYDTISTPAGKQENILGGSANYFSIVASMFAPVNVVGVVGEDYKDSDLEILTSRNVDVKGLKKEAGKTFHWEGRYQEDMNEAETLVTDLNVFQDFNPQIPEEYKSSKYLFLANIDPELQMQVLDQVENPKMVAMDTMNFWISSKIDSLKKALNRVDVLLINEGEAKELTGEWNAISASKQLVKMGPKAVVVKRGEYGFVLYSKGKFFIMPAFPIAEVVDPTGAGDTFAAGFFGHLAKVDGNLDFASLKQACAFGTLMASFTVQGFGVSRLQELTWDDFEKRKSEYTEITGLK